jgi:hypothetical protein
LEKAVKYWKFVWSFIGPAQKVRSTAAVQAATP